MLVPIVMVCNPNYTVSEYTYENAPDSVLIKLTSPAEGVGCEFSEYRCDIAAGILKWRGR